MGESGRRFKIAPLDRVHGETLSGPGGHLRFPGHGFDHRRGGRRAGLPDRPAGAPGQAGPLGGPPRVPLLGRLTMRSGGAGGRADCPAATVPSMPRAPAARPRPRPGPARHPRTSRSTQDSAPLSPPTPAAPRPRPAPVRRRPGRRCRSATTAEDRQSGPGPGDRPGCGRSRAARSSARAEQGPETSRRRHERADRERAGHRPGTWVHDLVPAHGRIRRATGRVHVPTAPPAHRDSVRSRLAVTVWGATAWREGGRPRLPSQKGVTDRDEAALYVLRG